MKVTISEWMSMYRAGVYVRVYLDGVDITEGCTDADEEGGFVVRLKRGENGRVRVVDSNTPDSGPETEVVFGQVRLVPCPR